MDGTAAKRIADKYITPDGGKPKERKQPRDEEPFGPSPEGEAAREAAREAERERARARFEAERALLDAKATEARTEHILISKLGKLMKKKHIAIGGWRTHPDVLAAIEFWSSKMKSQRWMASKIGKALTTFEEAMHKDKGENALRLAYEAGRATAEQRHIDACETLDPTDSKQVVGWIFYMKAQFGWKDRPDVSQSEAPKITFVLPGPMSEADYLKALGIEAPVDTRPKTDRTRVLGDSSVGDMRDVTPGTDGKLPTLGAQKVLAGEK